MIISLIPRFDCTDAIQSGCQPFNAANMSKVFLLILVSLLGTPHTHTHTDVTDLILSTADAGEEKNFRYICDVI